MNKRAFKVGLVASLVISLTSLVIPVNPVAAAGASLTGSDNTSNIQFSGSAYFGGNTSPVMSQAQSLSIKPYNYGAYVLFWNFSNPNRNTIDQVTATTFICSSPTQCATETQRQTFPVSNRRATADTYRVLVERADFHKRWIRIRMQVTFSDGTPTITNWSNSRYYISDAPRNEIPKPSSLSADNSSVPPSTALTMTFNQWTGLTEWDAGAQLRYRSLRVLRCTSRPTDAGSAFVSNVTTPAGCTRIATNPIFDPHDNQAKTLSFTSGAEGTFIYAIDTLSFNNMPDSGDIVYLQKRAIYSTVAVAQAAPAVNPGAGAGAGVAVDPAAPSGGNVAVAQTPLEAAGINTTTASVITATGQITFNGINLNLRSKTRYKRSKLSHTFILLASPQASSAGKISIALVKKKNGKDVVRKKASKQVSKGKAAWKWNFSSKLPVGRYRLYVTFTPSDSSLSPVTLTRVIRLS